MNRNKFFILTLFGLLSTVGLRGQSVFNSTNIDEETVAAMKAAYYAQVAEEVDILDVTSHITIQYTAASVSTAGMWYAKSLEHKAKRNILNLGDETENRYYTRIYKLVKNNILPKIWTVTKLMFNSPQTALYWTTYVYKVCLEVKSLCMEFESVVTNGALSFSDITFLDLAPEIKDLLNFFFQLDGYASTGAGTSFSVPALSFDKLASSVEGAISSVSQLTGDISSLYNLVSSGSSGVSSFVDIINSGVSFIEDGYNAFSSISSTIDRTFTSLLTDPTSFFTSADYNISAWISNYEYDSSNEYYTQQACVVSNVAASEEVLCEWTPNTSNFDPDEWLKVECEEGYSSLSDSEIEELTDLIFSFACLSKDEIEQLNSVETGYTYSYTLLRPTYTRDVRNSDGSYAGYKYFTSGLKIYRTYTNAETLYCDTFDSYSMDWTSFNNNLLLIRDMANENEAGVSYTIEYGDKVYYNRTDATKMAGVNLVTFYVTCCDTIPFAEGSSTYKCNTCTGEITEHTRQCSMEENSDDDSLDLTEITETIDKYQAIVDDYQAQIDELEDECTELLHKIADSSTSSSEAESYRDLYECLQETLRDLRTKLNEAKSSLIEAQEAYEMAVYGESITTEDNERIPAIMRTCERAYGVQWRGEGTWQDDTTYVRHASALGFESSGDMQFKAVISIARKPSYFLGIKIHRAIVQIDWSLVAYNEAKTVVDQLKFDSTTSDEEKADQVNAKRQEITQDYPECTESEETSQNEAQEEENEDKVYHLLWASDRIDLARDIYSRLTGIYGDLILLERVMYFKHNILDTLFDGLTTIDWEKGRHLTTIQKCHKKWLTIAKGYEWEDDDL